MILMTGKEENITDSIFKLARQLSRYKIRNKKAGRYVKSRLLEFNRLANEAIAMIGDMHTTGSITKMRALRSKIKVIENDGDAVRDALLDFAYNSKTEFKEFYHIVDLAYIYDDILDDCEDSSDIFMSIILSMIT